MQLPMLRVSERISFLECQQRWWWGWREGYRPHTSKPNALWFGTGVHLALANYYQPRGKGLLKGFKRGPHPAFTWARYVADSHPRFFKPHESGLIPEEEWVDMVKLGAAMLQGYVDNWEKEDEHWEFLVPEYAFSVVITGYDDEPLVHHVGTFDGVFRDHADEGRCKLLETKTAARISTRHLPMDLQAKDYRLVANTTLADEGILGAGETIDTIVFNFLRKSMPDERPKDTEGYALNKDGSRSRRQPLKMYERYPVTFTPHEQQTTLDHIRDEVEQMQAIRDGYVKPTKNPGFQAQNCNTCPFADPCSLHESGADYQEFFDLMFRREDPYADHRDGAKSSKFI